MNSVWQEGGLRGGGKKVSAIPCLRHAVWKISLPSFSSFSPSVSVKGVQSLLDEGRSAVGLEKEV